METRRRILYEQVTAICTIHNGENVTVFIDSDLLYRGTF